MTLYRSIGAALEDDNTGTNPIDVRKGLGGLFVRAGVLPGGTSPLVSGTAGWAYNLGAAPWVTQTATGDGYHLWGNDGAVTVGTSGVGGTVPSAPGAGLSRIDILWVRHPSNGENGDTASAPAAGVAVGTAASYPTAPALPAGAFELARNTMTSAATTTASTGNTITQTAPYTAPQGGVVSVRNTAEMALVTGGSATCPAFVWQADVFRLLRDAGGGFRAITPAAGIAAGTTSADGILSFAHGLGYTPTRMSVAVAGTGFGTGSDLISSLATAVLWAATATNLDVRIVRRDTNGWYASTAIAVAWTAA